MNRQLHVTGRLESRNPLVCIKDELKQEGNKKHLETITLFCSIQSVLHIIESLNSKETVLSAVFDPNYQSNEIPQEIFSFWMDRYWIPNPTNPQLSKESIESTLSSEYKAYVDTFQKNDYIEIDGVHKILSLETYLNLFTYRFVPYFVNQALRFMCTRTAYIVKNADVLIDDSLIFGEKTLYKPAEKLESQTQTEAITLEATIKYPPQGFKLREIIHLLLFMHTILTDNNLLNYLVGFDTDYIFEDMTLLTEYTISQYGEEIFNDYPDFETLHNTYKETS